MPVTEPQYGEDNMSGTGGFTAYCGVGNFHCVIVLLIINRVRVLGSGPHTPTQFLGSIPPPFPAPGQKLTLLISPLSAAGLTLSYIPENSPMATMTWLNELPMVSVKFTAAMNKPNSEL